MTGQRLLLQYLNGIVHKSIWMLKKDYMALLMRMLFTFLRGNFFAQKITINPPDTPTHTQREIRREENRSTAPGYMESERGTIGIQE